MLPSPDGWVIHGSIGPAQPFGALLAIGLVFAALWNILEALTILGRLAGLGAAGAGGVVPPSTGLAEGVAGMALLLVTLRSCERRGQQLDTAFRKWLTSLGT